MSRCALHGLYTWEFEDHWLVVTRHDISVPGLGEGFDAATIAHITDLHCSPIMRQRHLRKYIEIVNHMQPDFVVLTGDFITGRGRGYVRRIGELLGELSPAIESLACLGNHDYGIWHPRVHDGVPDLAEYVVEQLASAGVQTLLNASHTFRRNDSVLNFVGLADLWTNLYDPIRAFDSLAVDQPTIALCHNPDAAPELARMGARYVMSGHTHGRLSSDGRLDNLLFPSAYPKLVAGEYSLGQDSSVYINSGIGGRRRPQNRQKPEIALFTLRDCPVDDE